MVCRYFKARSSEHFRGAGRLDLHLVPRGDEFAGYHLFVALARTHHRIDTRIRIDHDLEERRSVETDELLDDPWHVFLAVEAHRVAKAVGLSRADEVLLVQGLVARRQPALEEELLPLLHHAVAE